MRKLLLSMSLLLASMTAAFAQVPDASEWANGEEITDKVSWGNLSFQNNPFDFWKYSCKKNDQGNVIGSFNMTVGLFEAYDAQEVDLYQYIQLPAGMYRVECQGYYRCGNSWSDDPAAFDTKNWEDNAFLYVQDGAYDIDSEEFTPNRKFQTPLMPRLFPRYGENGEEQIYEDMDYQVDAEGNPVLDDNGNKKYNAGWNRSDGKYLNNTIWGPCSVDGSLMWFDMGLYQAYSDDEGVKYNTVTFFLESDCWVKIAVSKQKAKSADSFMVTDFKLYYEGQVDAETAELMAAQDRVLALYNKLSKMISSADEGFFCNLMTESLMAYEDEYGSDPKSIDNMKQLTEAEQYLTELSNDIEKARGEASKLQSLVSAMRVFCNKTDYDGKATFEAKLEAAESLFADDREVQPGETMKIYTTTYDELIQARMDYLMSQTPDENDARDFSAFINFPFFVNNEYTPTWDAEAGCYKYPDEIESTYVVAAGEKSVNEIKESNSEWPDIISDVTWRNAQDAVGEWIFDYKINGWMGQPSKITMQHGYTALGEWAASPQGGYEELRQVITGLPEGYYSLSALFITTGLNPAEYNMFAYVNPGSKPDENTMAKAFCTKACGPWWNGASVNQVQAWRTTDGWEMLKTNMVKCEDGTLTIGARSNGFYAVTGFQLQYYGATPKFTDLLAPSLVEAQNNVAAANLWPGDATAVNAIFDKIPAQIETPEAYAEAVANLKAITDYVTKAKAAYTDFENKTIANFGNLQTKQAEESDEATIVETALSTVMGLGMGDDDTYQMALDAAKDYTAYEEYLDYRASIGELINEATIAPIVAEQNADLKENYANAEKLTEYKNAIANKYLAAYYRSIGADEATLDKGVEVTSLLVNPDFSQGPAKGWSGIEGTSNDYGKSPDLKENYLAELWNKDPFTLSQKVKLLAGTYKLTVRALYRDGGGVNDELLANYEQAVEEAANDGVAPEEKWSNHNAVLFAKPAGATADNGLEKSTYIKAVESLVSNAPSFTEFKGGGIDEGKSEMDASGENWTYIVYKREYDIDVIGENANNPSSMDAPQYPFDTRIGDNFYPCSMAGFYWVCQNNPEAYNNEVTVYLPEDGELEVGIRKTAKISNDWVIYDDFRLWYLGTDAPTAIANVGTSNTKVATGIYTVNGTKVKALQQGINIVKYSDGTTKKVYVGR